MRLFNLLILTLILSACGGKGKSSSTDTGGVPVDLRYATNLSLTEYDDYAVATLRNPWDTTKVLHTYVLVDKKQPLPAALPDGT
ncbi:MAG: ABC transporter substrate-binding protein, partial [Bacteroides sp.]